MRPASSDNTAYLVDASIYVFRAWFAFGDQFFDNHGHPAGAIFGFARFIADFLQRSKAKQMAFAFDASLASSFRNDIYADYKANREHAPPELKRQFEHAQSLVAALGIHVMVSDRFEADDLINAMAIMARTKGHPICIVTMDKDLTQCLDRGDELWDFSRDRVVTPITLVNDLGINPEQVADYLAIAGDAVDNIPGIPGLGKKSAAALLQAFGSLDGIYADLDKVPTLSFRGAARAARLLAEHRERVFMFRQLTVLHPQAGLAHNQASRLVRQPADWGLIDAMIDDLRLGDSLKSRFRECLD